VLSGNGASSVLLFSFLFFFFRFHCIDDYERRHVKALESRSQLLDAALASADEANRRWEECRSLVDQLRIENAALRAELNQLQMGAGPGGPANHGAQNSMETASVEKIETNSSAAVDGSTQSMKD
jgi:hypothetical protein